MVNYGPGYGLSWVAQKPFITIQAGPNGSACIVYSTSKTIGRWSLRFSDDIDISLKCKHLLVFLSEFVVAVPTNDSHNDGKLFGAKLRV